MQHGGILGLQVASWLLCSIVLLFDKYYGGIKVQLSFGRFLKVIDARKQKFLLHRVMYQIKGISSEMKNH
jgi:hypothetical protein